MKICIAQTRPKGDIEANIVDHINWVNQAANQNADFIIFSELSLTGYEPELAKDLAIEIGDTRLNGFQEVSDAKDIIICVGAPTKANDGTCISLVIFQPNKERSLYSKQYLHEDELPYFVPGPPNSGIIEAKERIALAICYELTISEHAEKANKNGAEVYIASVAKTVNGVARNNPRLAQIAKQYQIPVLMCNCVGEFDGNVGGGQSAVWNEYGELIEVLSEQKEEILVFESY
jgi:predicted amidohydrolase